MRPLVFPPLVLLLLLTFPQPVWGQVAAVDSIFAAFSGTDRPGCTVGLGTGQDIVLQRAYGMADLEHRVVNTPETVLEPGSVSKQFTAAAVILLALDGALSLDDDVRTYIPELPDYGDTITIRHLLNHTSGLRDWGSVAGIEGWPRTSRVHTHKHALDIAARQKSLNYPPGEYYSYTNTGYNLLAIIVERVSGMSFAEFSRVRVFEPNGMYHTQWRDDFTRVVANRAVAYRPNEEGGFNMLMPFENVHGNGGLLTTAGDLLRFAFRLQRGTGRFVEEMHRQGVLNNGREIAYASGLVVGDYRGTLEVSHSGATAGYRGYLSRFPEQDVAVAVMCNVSSANARQLAHAVADLYLSDLPNQPLPTVEPLVRLPVDRLEALSGRFTRGRDGSVMEVEPGRDGLRVGGNLLVSVTGTRFQHAEASLEFVSEDEAIYATVDRDTMRLARAEPFSPTPEELVEYTGEYRSDEAEVTYRIAIRDGALQLVDRYDSARALTPLLPDTFRMGGSRFRFLRDRRQQITGFSLSQGRIWDLRFGRLK